MHRPRLQHPPRLHQQNHLLALTQVLQHVLVKNHIHAVIRQQQPRPRKLNPSKDRLPPPYSGGCSISPESTAAPACSRFCANCNARVRITAPATIARYSPCRCVLNAIDIIPNITYEKPTIAAYAPISTDPQSFSSR